MPKYKKYHSGNEVKSSIGIGAFLPEVKIVKITLEDSTTDFYNPFDKNPHIEGYTDDVKSGTDATSEMAAGTQGLIDASAAQNKDKSLYVTLDLELQVDRNTLKNNSWIHELKFGDAQKSFMDYLRLCILQVRGPTAKMTEAVLEPSNGTTTISNPSVTQNPKNFENIYAKSADTLAENKITLGVKTDSLLGYFSEKNSNNALSNGKLDDGEEYPFFTSLDNNGVETFHIPYKAKFQIKKSTLPTHLGYVAYTHIDFFGPDGLVTNEGLSGVFGDEDGSSLLQMQDQNAGFLKSNYSAWSGELVFKDSDLVTKREIYLDQKGNIWQGPAHIDQNGVYRTGYSQAHMNTYYGINSEILTRKVVPNTKIQDFRTRNSIIASTPINFQEIETELDLRLKMLTNDNLDVFKKMSYFSDAYMSKDSHGKARFIFSLDQRALLRDNSPFPALYFDLDQANKLVDMSKFLSIKVFRRRVKNNMTYGANKLANPTSPEPLEDKIVAPKLMIETAPSQLVKNGGKAMQKVAMKSTQDGSKARFNIQQIEIASKDAFSSPYYRHFVCVDHEVSREKRGYYQYGIEVYMQEGSREFLNIQFNKLTEARHGLEKYLQYCLLRDSDGRPYYDRLYNRFTQNFKSFMLDGFQYTDIPNENVTTKPWLFPIKYYLDVLKILMGKAAFNKIEGQNSELSTKLYSYINYETGTPEGIMTMIRLVNNLSAKLETILGNVPTIKNSFFNSSQQSKTTGGKVPPVVFTKNHYFPQVFDAFHNPKNHFDFLSTDSVLDAASSNMNSTNLLTFSKERYETRCVHEDKKYFQSNVAENQPGASTEVFVNIGGDDVAANPGDNLLTSRYAFLTPSFINLEGRSTTQLIQKNQSDALFFNPSKFVHVLVDIFRYNKSLESVTFNDMMVKQRLGSSGYEQAANIKFLSLRTKLKDLYGDHYSCTFESREAKKAFDAWRTLQGADGSATQNIFKKFLEDHNFPTGESSSASILKSLLDWFQNNTLSEGGFFSAGNYSNTIESFFEFLEYGGFDRNAIDQSFVGEKYPFPELDLAVNPNRVLMSTLSRLIGIGKTWDDWASGELLSGDPNTPIVRHFNSMKNYDLKLASNPLILAAVGNLFTQLVGGDSLGESMPNSIKSLYMSSRMELPASKIVKEKFVKKDSSKDMFLDPAYFPFMYYNFKMIKHVEVFTGFGGVDGMKDDHWKTLTNDRFNNSIGSGRFLLCRLRDYVFKPAGVYPSARNELINLPTINEYFLIDTQFGDATTPPITVPINMIDLAGLDIIQKIGWQQHENGDAFPVEVLPPHPPLDGTEAQNMQKDGFFKAPAEGAKGLPPSSQEFMQAGTAEGAFQGQSPGMGGSGYTP
tara:strand:- start:789 stop:4856 length:4068 start_codon:yes stop_codon:yes gene_type:complete